MIDYHPGPVDITVPGGATASFQGDNGLDSVLGPATVAPEGTDEANPFDVVSLGDGGWITLGFAQPITNGDGADFAVFENGFQAIGDQYFLELAHVAVSSDGIHFFTFPSVSLTQTTTQVGGFGTLDPTYIYNLAGRDVASFGTPFDLQELAGIDPLLDINRITQVRITDAVGSILPAYASYDSLGNIINDQWKTNFTNGGFDLDAVGVIHPIPEPAALCWLASGAALLAWFRRGRSRA